MMMTVKQIEAPPALYPAVDGASGETLAAAWQRVEHHIAWRFSPREVIWRVLSDGGEWQPPLAPVTAITVQVGTDAPYEPESGPMGGWMLPCGTVKVSATVGKFPAPWAVLTAVRRLAAYLAAGDKLPAGVTRFSSGSFNAAVRWDQISPALAIVNSGAADLLRPYRRATWAS